jgi:hypothetical protein
MGVFFYWLVTAVARATRAAALAALGVKAR